ncbi:MAG: leucine-rich repeat domain-containing protein [Prevotella sp.]|nr:leucine-rich repeat domain-containing protein [Prevotella sp.]
MVIPSTVEYDGKTYIVTAINDEAFSGCSIDTLIVPMTVNKVGPVGGTVDHLFIDSWFWWSMLQDTKNDRKVDFSNYYPLPVSLLCCAVYIHVGGQEYDTEHLVLPEGLTSIPDYAVMGSSRMKSITIPSTMTSIGKAFCHNCVSLLSAVIPDNITFLGGLAFSYCKSLEEVVIGDGIETISDHSFYRCQNLKTITVGRGLKSIEKNNEVCVSNIIIRDMATWCGLKGCGTLTCHDIPYRLFDSNGNEILNVTVPNGVEAIEEYCFYKSSIQSVSLPASVKSIGDWAFYNCLSLQNIAIPSKSLLESIGVYAFHRCDLTSVTIPDLTKSIKQGAFCNCLNLSTVVLGRSVIDIGSGAFSIDSWEEGTPKPMTVMSRIEEPYAIPNDVFSEITYRNGALYVPEGTKEQYARFDGWRNFLNIQERSEASDKCLLTIQDASGGKVKLVVKMGEQYNLQIELEKGWQLHSITLDGEDMTSRLSDDLRFTTPVIAGNAPSG